MRSTIILIFTILLISIIDLYFYKSLKSVFSERIIKTLAFNISFVFIGVLALLLLFTAYFKVDLPTKPFSVNYFYFFLGFFILFYIPKIHILVFHFIEDIESIFFSRYQIITKIGFYSAIIVFLFIFHGIFINKYNFKLREQVVSFKNLPSEFDGYKIIQISDLHIGSFHNNVNQVEKIVDIINDESPDLVVFTGDMISNTAEEIDEFLPVLSNIKSKDGKISILGNHDYGDYVKWESEEEKQQNLLDLIQKEESIGFTLLKNNNIRIERNNTSIIIAGVENWGKPPFAQLGDLEKALNNTTKNDFIVLLSHDPSHWREEILKDRNIDLTLSGHTHAMQFGFELGSWQWSPVSIKYKEWGGLYSENAQFLYVNRGTGFIGFPGRVGIKPEITMIVLKSEVIFYAYPITSPIKRYYLSLKKLFI